VARGCAIAITEEARQARDRENYEDQEPAIVDPAGRRWSAVLTALIATQLDAAIVDTSHQLTPAPQCDRGLHEAPCGRFISLQRE
jgi:hypothetical protein